MISRSLENRFFTLVAAFLVSAGCLLGFTRGLSAQTSSPVTSTLPRLPSTPQAPGSSQATPNAGADRRNTQTGQRLEAGSPSVGQEPRNYIISPGDTLDISVYDAADLSGKSVVTSRGEVYMPLVDSVPVAGLSIEDGQAAIERAYKSKGFLKNPHVALAVLEYARGVDVMGEIARPGTYPVAGSRRLSEVLALAGGTTQLAGQVVTITRWPDGRQENVQISEDASQLMKSDVWVRQGDTVFIAKAGVVFIVGEVLQPSEFVMQEKTQYTVMKLVAMAHGTTHQAKLSDMKIVRKSPGGAVTEIAVPYNKILVSKAPDVPLLPDDIVFVPTSKARNAAIKSADIALSLATGLTILAVTRF